MSNNAEAAFHQFLKWRRLVIQEKTRARWRSLRFLMRCVHVRARAEIRAPDGRLAVLIPEPPQQLRAGLISDIQGRLEAVAETALRHHPSCCPRFFMTFAPGALKIGLRLRWDDPAVAAEMEPWHYLTVRLQPGVHKEVRGAVDTVVAALAAEWGGCRVEDMSFQVEAPTGSMRR